MQMRELILGGTLAPGSTLPTMHQLAEQFSTSYFTIQTALTPLVEEGLLERRRRTGTTVRRHPIGLSCAAIYGSSGFLDTTQDGFSRELCRHLHLQLAAQDVRTEAFLDTRPPAAMGRPLPALVQAVEDRVVQAVIVPRCDQVTLPWLRRLPVVTAFATSAQIPNRVAFDHAQMLRLGLERLREGGCSRVGLISSIQNPHRDPEGMEARFHEAFVTTLRDLKLETRDAWIRVPREWQPRIELYGYEQFHALWRQPERPQGVLVYPDVTARGVLTAALERNVRVPEEMRMVFHRNVGIDFVCPLSVDWVESDVAACAGALIEQVHLQKRGSEVQEIILPHHLC